MNIIREFKTYIFCILIFAGGVIMEISFEGRYTYITTGLIIILTLVFDYMKEVKTACDDCEYKQEDK